jgi:CRISPR/Cas system-associated exonuclease Cas4 (RecB family)
VGAELRDPSAPGWTSASDLAEYAYCPRAHYYRHHPPPRGPDADSVRRAGLGERYHAQALAAEIRRSAASSRALWALVGLALVLLLVALVWISAGG